MSLLDDLVSRLVSQSLAVFGTDLFADFMPETPDACASLREYGGPVEFTHDAQGYERVRVQLLVRGVRWDYSTPRTRCAALMGGLHFSNTTINGTRYLLSRPIGAVYSIGHDDTERPRVGCTIAVEKET